MPTAPERLGGGTPSGGRCEPINPAEPKGVNIMTQPTDNATSWRDLIDQLPDHLVARYTRIEADYDEADDAYLRQIFPDREPADIREGNQRDMLQEAREQLRFAHIPLPPNPTTWLCALRAEPWECDDLGECSRLVFGPKSETLDGRFVIEFSATQRGDGHATWSMQVICDEELITAEDARHYSEMLAAAAAEIDRIPLTNK